MPSIRDQLDTISSVIEELEKDITDGDMEDFAADMVMLKSAIQQLGAMALQTVTRYDYWRRTYCAKTQITESEFDAMTDECIHHEGEPEEACKHLVVTPMGRCANCGKRV